MNVNYIHSRFSPSVAMDNRVKELETAVFTLIITHCPRCAGNVPEAPLITCLF